MLRLLRAGCRRRAAVPRPCPPPSSAARGRVEGLAGRADGALRVGDRRPRHRRRRPRASTGPRSCVVSPLLRVHPPAAHVHAVVECRYAAGDCAHGTHLSRGLVGPLQQGAGAHVARHRLQYVSQEPFPGSAPRKTRTGSAAAHAVWRRRRARRARRCETATTPGERGTDGRASARASEAAELALHHLDAQLVAGAARPRPAARRGPAAILKASAQARRFSSPACALRVSMRRGMLPAVMRGECTTGPARGRQRGGAHAVGARGRSHRPRLRELGEDVHGHVDEEEQRGEEQVNPSSLGCVARVGDLAEEVAGHRHGPAQQVPAVPAQKAPEVDADAAGQGRRDDEHPADGPRRRPAPRSPASGTGRRRRA